MKKWKKTEVGTIFTVKQYMQYIKYVCRNVLDPLEMKRDENPSLKLFAFNSHAHIHEN